MRAADIQKHDKPRKKNNGGFTMVELVVVIVIIMILAGGLIFGAMKWVEWTNFKRQNEYAQILFGAAQNQLTEYSESGRIEELRSSLVGQNDKYLHPLDIEGLGLKDRDGEEFKLTSVWPESADKGEKASLYQGEIVSIVLTADDYKDYQQGRIDNEKKAAYDLFAEYIYDSSILKATICIEFAPEEGQLFDVFYSDSATGFEYNTENKSRKGTVDITSRDEKERRLRMTGYYGVDQMGKATSAKVEKPSISNVMLNNEELLNLSFTLSKIPESAQELTYEITVCDKSTKKPILSVKLTGKDIKNKNFRQKAECDVWRINYDENGKAETQSLGKLPFLTWIEKDEGYQKDPKIRLVLDGADLTATSALYYSAYPSLMQTDSSRISSTVSPDLVKLQNTYSFRRFGLQTQNIYCTVQGSGVFYKTTAKKQSNSEQCYFGSEQTEKTNNKESMVYSIKNARHLYNVRYMEDYTEEQRAAWEGLKTAANVKYRLESNVDWSTFKENGALFRGADDNSAVKNAEFPSVKQLRTNMIFESAGKKVYTISGLTMSDVSNADAGLYADQNSNSQQKAGSAGLFITNNGTLQNFKLDKTVVKGQEHVGSFCGTNGASGKLNNLESANSDGSSQVSGQKNVGGITGGQTGAGAGVNADYEELVNRAKVTGRENVGGIVGSLESQAGDTILVKNCENYGKTGAASDAAVKIGGIAGYCKSESTGKLSISSCNGSPQYETSEIEEIVGDSDKLDSLLKGSYVGGIVGQNDGGSISACNTKKETNAKEGYLFGEKYVGGIVGYNVAAGQALDNGGIVQGVSEIHVIGENYVGGIVGANAAFAEDSSAVPNPDPKHTDSTVSNWTIKGMALAVTDGSYAGGVTGYNTGIINNCSCEVMNNEAARTLRNSANLKGSYVGGIAGYNGNEITSDFNRMAVCYVAGKDFVGGIAGYNAPQAVIVNYEITGGYVRGSGSYVGGVAGFNASAELLYDGKRLNSNPNEVSGKFCIGGTFGANIINCDSEINAVFNNNNFLGAVEAEQAFAGGFIGYNGIVDADSQEIQSMAETTARRLDAIAEGGDGTEQAQLLSAVQLMETSVTELGINDGRLTISGEEDTYAHSRFSSITAQIYVAGVVGCNHTNTNFSVKNVQNMARVIAESAIENVEEQPDVLLTYDGVSPFTYSYAGGIIGKVTTSTILTDCSNQDVGDVTTRGTYLGGICEINEGWVVDCSASSIGTNNSDYVGGIAGLNKESGTIQDCHFVNKTITGRNYVGGIAAENYGKIEHVEVDNGIIRATGTVGAVGGIVGYGYAGSNSRIKVYGKDSEKPDYSNIDVNIYSEGKCVGGIVGINDGELDVSDNASTSGSVSGGQFVGGLVGMNRSEEIKEFTNNASVTSTDGDAGGIAGKLENAGAKIIHCFNYGEISSTKSGNAGGIIGSNIGVIEDCINYAGVSAVNGISGGITGVNEAEITSCSVIGKSSKEQLTFLGKLYVGGIAGQNTGTIIKSNVENIIAVNTEESTGSMLGGITGQNGAAGVIRQCNAGMDASQEIILLSYAADISAGGIAGTNAGVIEGESGEFSKVYAQLSFRQTDMAYYGNLGGVAGSNTGTIQYYEFNGSVHGTSNNPMNSPTYDPNYDMETSGAQIYGYGGIAGFNGDSAGQSKADIRNCKVNRAEITGLGDANNVANIGGIAGVNALKASIREVGFGCVPSGSKDSYKIYRTDSSPIDTVKSGRGNVYVGTGAVTTAYAHTGGIAGLNSGSITNIGYGDNKDGEIYSAVNDGDVIIENYRGHVGGIAGYNRRLGEINNVSTGKSWIVFAPDNAQDNGCGGIIGYSASEKDLSYCVNRATVQKSVGSSNAVGGMVGRLECATSSSWNMNHCTNYGIIYGQMRVGGMIGVWKYYGGTLSDCINYGEITGGSQGAGGIVGMFYGVASTSPIYIVRCQNHGFIVGDVVAGIAANANTSSTGSVYLLINDCVNTGLLRTKQTKAAGILGDFNITNTTRISSCTNYGYEYENKAMSGISVRSNTTNTLNCLGIANVKYPISSKQVGATNYYIGTTDSGKGGGIGVQVVGQGSNYQLEKTNGDGKKEVIGKTGFTLNPAEVFAVSANKVSEDKALLPLRTQELPGNTTNNIRYQVFLADDSFFEADVNYEEMDPPEFDGNPVMGNAEYTIKWKAVKGAVYYTYKAYYYNKDGGLLGVDNLEGPTRSDIVYGTSATLPVSAIDGEDVDKIVFKVCTGPDSATVKYSSREFKVKPVLPAPEYHLQLELDQKTNKLLYRVYLDNQQEYIDFLNQWGSGTSLSQIQIMISVKSDNKTAFTAEQGVSGYTMDGTHDNAMYTGYAKVSNGEFTSSSKPMRESQSMTHTDYTGDRGENDCVGIWMWPHGDEKSIGFKGNTANTLSYQLKIASKKVSVESGTVEFIPYMRSELMATDMKLNVPVALSTSMLRVSNTTGTKISTALGPLPEDALDSEAYDQDSVMVRSYPTVMSNNIVYIGHTVDISAVKANSDITGLTQGELTKLYVTADHQVTRESGDNTQPLIGTKNGEPTVADGFVIELAADKSYTLYYNALLEYNSVNGNEYSYESLDKNGNAPQKTQVFYYLLENDREAAPVPIIHTNTKEEILAEDNLEISWDLASDGENYKKGAEYDYVITGITADQKSVQISAGDYTTSQTGEENKLTFDTSTWNYKTVKIVISRRGTVNSTTEMTTIFPSSATKTIFLLQSFSQITKPTLVLHRNEQGEVQKNSLDYDITWENLPESERTSDEMSAYEVTVKRLESDTAARKTYDTKSDFDAALESAKQLYAEKSGREPEQVPDENRLIYTWQVTGEGASVTKTMNLRWEISAQGSAQGGTILKELTVVWSFEPTEGERGSDSDTVQRLLDLNDFERGEMIEASVRALAIEDGKTYRSGIQGIAREMQLPSRLDVPNVEEMAGTPEYLAHEEDSDSVTYMTLDEFKNDGILLSLKPSNGNEEIQGKYNIAAAIYDDPPEYVTNPEPADETQTAGKKDKVENPGDGDGTESGYWNTGAVMTVITKGSETEMDGNLQEASCVLKLDSTTYAGKWIKIALRSISESTVSSLWTDEDETAEGTVNYRWIHIPRVQLEVPETAQNTKTLYYDTDGYWGEEALTSASILTRQTMLSFDEVEESDFYQIQVVRSATSKTIESQTESNEYWIYHVDWIYMEKVTDGSYDVFYNTTNPLYVRPENVDPDTPVSVLDESAVYIGEMSGQGSLELPYTGNAVKEALDTEDMVTTRSKLERTIQADGTAGFAVVLPDAEEIKTYVGAENLFTSQVSVCAKNTEDNLSRHEDSKIFEWYRTSGNGTETKIADKYDDAPESEFTLSLSQIEGTAYELRETKTAGWLVFQIEEVTDDGSTINRGRISSYGRDGIIDNVAFLSKEKYADLTGKTIHIRAAAIVSGGSLSKWSDWQSCVVPELVESVSDVDSE